MPVLLSGSQGTAVLIAACPVLLSGSQGMPVLHYSMPRASLWKSGHARATLQHASCFSLEVRACPCYITACPVLIAYNDKSL
ncbi:hypothetical protein JCGZ_22920 [Jatropha curcas]|uniref:Uncharacterized protein n=1 Tax=Jatropha curcas TaxID=180498 RepID=A0A067L772_JATCU|nr:hypothetical protein JCGZ_22920 [Jatropha curcas]